jgi:hypothetical protein
MSSLVGADAVIEAAGTQAIGPCGILGLPSNALMPPGAARRRDQRAT